MLAIAKLTPGQEGYYERSVAPALDDYYAGRGESPGLWFGRGAAALELEGVIEQGELGKLVRGLHPKTDDRLRRHPKQRTITIERIDPETGERRSEQKKLNPVAGFDLVFSAPKSISLLYALGGEEAQLAVAQAHAAAWQAAVTYLEDEACVTRRGRNGVIREHAEGFVAAAYQHRTNRAQEPHLHTHVIVANMARSPDGTWRALDGEALLKNHRLAAGYLYQAHLRRELSQRLGVRWREPIKGMAELRGVPAAVLREFSTRRTQVLEYLADRGTAGFYAAAVAQVETRGAEFLRVVRELAERAGVDTSALDRPEPRDRRAELLSEFFDLARGELAGERGQAARAYLESRGFPREGVASAELGVVPSTDRIRNELIGKGYESREIDESGLVADRRWPGRVCGAWRDERGRIRTLWARTVDRADDAGSKYLYLRGASRTGLPPYGLSEVLARPSAERRELVLVEGLLDVHHFRARAISNVVSLGGTSATPETFERLARVGFTGVTICLDRDGPGRMATARVLERAVRATQSPAVLVLDAERLAPQKDPDAFLREQGVEAWLELLTKRECGVTWRARELLAGTTTDSPVVARREALARAGTWLGTLPARLSLEQEDAVRVVAERCGYTPEAVNRAFQARYWAHRADVKPPQRTALELG